MADPLEEVAELFEAALELPLAERPAFLDLRCAGRDALRAEVESLLRHADSRHPILDQPPAGLEELVDARDTPELVGPYRLLEPLGEGGFGVVWLAEQQEPISRRVALKLIKPGLGSRGAVQRFEAERQALALLDHPGIARIHDAGETPDGRPWFAMELVDGPSITGHCEAQRVGMAERVRLVVEVCDAVHHAHQKGIVHRDLKPTNVLVTTVAGRPRPKVIDFGVAKALQQPLTPGDALRTEIGQMVGTPAYMSPEQACGEVDAIDVRSDVHALGVILYELVTGTLPFAIDGPSGTPNLVELQRRIREEDAQRPSSRIAERLREADYRPPVLARAVRGDLDWIVLRALEKDPERRYASAHELGADLERFLRDEPVLAGPPSAAYRLRKLVRRHRVATAATIVAVLALVTTAVGTVASLVAVRASEAVAIAEAEKLRAVADFLSEMLSSANPDRGLGRDVTVRQILDDAGARLDSGLPAAVESALRLTVGSAYRALGRSADSEPQLRRALELMDATNSPERSDVRRELGLSFIEAGRLGEAQALIDQAVELSAGRPLSRCRALTARGVLALAEGRLAAAESAFRKSLELAGTTRAGERLRTALHIHLGDVLERAGRYTEAEAVLADARARAAAEGARGLPRLLEADSVLALLLVRRGEAERAEPVARRCVGLALRIHGENHPEVARHTSNLAELLQELDRLPEAEQLFRRAIAVLERASPSGSPGQAKATANLAWLLARLDRLDEAEQTMRAALEMKRRLLGPRHPDVASSLSDLAVMRRSRGDHADAESLGTEALAIYREAFGDDHLHTAIAAHSLGVTILEGGDGARALPLLESGLATGLRALSADHWQVAEFRKRLARALIAVGRPADAAEQFETAHASMVRAHGTDHRRTISCVKGMIDVALETRDFDLAATWRARLPEPQQDYALEAERHLRATAPRR